MAAYTLHTVTMYDNNKSNSNLNTADIYDNLDNIYENLEYKI